MPYPIEANAALVDEAEITAFADALYAKVDLEHDDYVVLRGIPERGTPHEGTKPTSYPVQAALVPLAPAIVYAARRWAQYKYASYLVPGVTKDPHGKADSIRLMTAVMVDLDKGDIDASLAHAITHIGPPSFFVASGGLTAEGRQKLHLWWLLREPSSDIAKCMRVRDLLARKLGGDRALGIAEHGAAIGRAHQPIRIPGTVYAKGEGDDAPSTRVAKLGGPILGDGVELDEILERLEEIPAAPGIELPPPRANGGITIPMGDLHMPRIEALRHDISEGGDEDRNRWSEFSRVAGGYIAQVRHGELDLPTAYAMTLGWMQLRMIPPWPEQRALTEFQALARLDTIHHPGNGAAGPNSYVAASLPFPVEGAAAAPKLVMLRADEIADEPVPEQEWLVEGMIPKGEACGLASDGAVGKSMLLLQLGLTLAGAFGTLEAPDWLGHRVHPVDGLVVIISAEDTGAEIRRRLHQLASRDELRAAGRLRIVSLPDGDGAQPIAASKRKRIGDELVELSGSTPFWNGVIAELKADEIKTSFVGMDTFSAMSHDDENKVKTIREFMREALRVPRELEATLMLTHHLRKHDEEGFKSADEALQAVRGSGGLPNALRAMTVIYKPKDWATRMRALGKRPVPKKLYCCGTPKLNKPGGDAEDVTLLRDEHGLLVAAEMPDTSRKDLGAMALSVRLCVLAGAPLTGTGHASGVYACKMRLHPSLRDYSRWRLERLLDLCERERRVVPCRIVGSRAQGAAFFDVPGGPLAQGEFTRDDMRGGAIKVDYARWSWSEPREDWVDVMIRMGG